MLHSVEQPVAYYRTYWTNDTCPLMTDASASCTRGYYAEYVIMAKTKDHIKAAVDFARDNNVRLVIRNTGHDLMGRSTGYGALVVNTHSFKDATFVKEYTGPGDWKGGAATVGAGIQVRELYRLANAQNPPVVVVGGECPVCIPYARMSIYDNSNMVFGDGRSSRWLYSRGRTRPYGDLLWHGYDCSCRYLVGSR